MNRYNQLLRAACTGLIAALMAGCAAHVAVCALGFEVSWLAVYGVAAFAAAAVQLARRGTAWTIGVTAALVLALGILLAACGADMAAILRQMAQGVRLDCTAYPSAGEGIALISALMMGALFSGLLRAASGASLALLVALAAMICALASNEDISLWTALPGLAAGVAAFGLPGDSHKGGVRPVLLVPAALLTLLAFVMAPAGRTTWAPLENLAAQVRSVVEDYFRFTEERLAFSINEKGYDHAGMIGEDVVAMLGGPADPDEGVVMRVQTDADMLLRGTIKRTYTGYSWVDGQAKARYLYYDFTHRGVRSDVFDTDTTGDIPSFSQHSAQVEMLDTGTSTLFVPGQLAEFEMNLADAVYYNSAGELFLTREVEAGDQYAFSARTPDSRDALIAACEAKASAQDERYSAMLADCTALPEGIDSRVYALAVELTGNTNNAAEKAYAIQEYLAKNYEYTLDGRYPEAGQDFVSWFLLEGKEGYCSYFASSMAVLCRIAGIPARYVEGYYVKANPGGETIITGENAHAWVEVYLNRLGWIAFDPTARTVEYQNGETESEEGSLSNHGIQDEEGRESPPGTGDAADAPDPTPTPTPDIGSNPDPTPDTGMNTHEDAPTPTPEPENDPSPQENDSDAQDEPDARDNPDNQDNSDDSGDDDHNWLWILLIVPVLLALAVLAALWIKRRLSDTDPLKLCAAARSSQMAAMILYRGMLTLLAQIGMAPMNGETPQAFAARATMNMPNPAYEHFVAEVAASRYSGRPVGRDALDAGRQAYAVFLNSMRRSERIRFHIRRVLHGLGSFENIP